MFRTYSKNDKPTENNEPIYLDTIKGYDYKLEERDTELFKTNFDALNKVLTNDEVDFEKYAEYLSKLYIIDLYTIKNKLNQYDVGSTEYILPNILENFELKVKDTIYKYLEDNEKGKRTQELPEVSDITLDKIEETKFTIDKTEYDAYTAELSWAYVKDLGYDKKATVVLVKSENKLYIAEQK